MQLCLNSTLQGNLCLSSWACKHSSDLTGKTYQACEKAASTLHAMVLLQVHQAQALKGLHKGGHDPQFLQEIRDATDLRLPETKVTVQSVGCAMSTMVVQECYFCYVMSGLHEGNRQGQVS